MRIQYILHIESALQYRANPNVWRYFRHVSFSKGK